MRNALFFDIDGTLLSDVTGKIPDSALDALKKTIELGNLTFINTGRCYCSVPMELKRAPFSGYLCGCGTYIMLGDEVMFSRIIPHKRGREIIRVLQENHAEPILEATDDCYFSKRITRFEGIEHTRRYFAPMGLGIETYIEQDRFDYDKFVFYYDQKTNLAAIKANLGKDMDLIDRQNGFFEVVPKGFSKASGIAYILEHMNIPMENAYVFGDSSNDLPMFQYVKHAVAMGVHSNVLEPYAEFVTKTVEEDGIAFAMKHYGLGVDFVCIHTEYSIMKRTKWASYIIPTISAGLKKHGSTGCGTAGFRTVKWKNRASSFRCLELKQLIVRWSILMILWISK